MEVRFDIRKKRKDYEIIQGPECIYSRTPSFLNYIIDCSKLSHGLLISGYANLLNNLGKIPNTMKHSPSTMTKIPAIALSVFQ